MTDQPFKLFQIHKQDLKSYFSPIVEEIMRLGDVEDGSPAGKIETVCVGCLSTGCLERTGWRRRS